MIRRSTKTIFAFPIIILLAISSFSVRAQEQEEGNYFDQSSIVARMHYGFLLAHHPNIVHLVRHTVGFEISLSRQTIGRKLWQQYFNYPQTGFSYIFLDFNNPGILGEAHALMAFINLPSKRTEHFQFSFRMAAGLGYLTKKYERVENYKNDVIGSHINAAIQFNFESRYKLSQHLAFNFNVGLTHFSNGSFKTPNLGINNPSANAGFTYRVQSTKEFIKSEIHQPVKSHEIDLLYATGIKEISPPTGAQYFSHTISSTFLTTNGLKFRRGPGLDLFYDVSLKLAFDRLDKNSDGLRILRSGIHYDVEMMLDRLTVLFNAGVYWLDQYKDDGAIYDRVGFKYLVSKNLFVNLTLKTHFAKADYVECGIGWKFKKDNSAR